MLAGGGAGVEPPEEAVTVAGLVVEFPPVVEVGPPPVTERGLTVPGAPEASAELAGSDMIEVRGQSEHKRD
jgi:hypothetical protein